MRLIAPQPYIYPRFKFSEQYGAVLFENTKMVHAMPGRFEYTYTINEYGYRGKAVPLSNLYERPNVIVLGDSYGFGEGVSDGEEFPAVLGRNLEPDYSVINLSVIGYGLTQEIRRFYEFAILYAPKVVVLQFCANDPSDNLYNQVTQVQGRKFQFGNTNNPVAWIKIYLSHSIIQKSQLYNFFRQRLFEYVHERVVVDARVNVAGGAQFVPDTIATAEEVTYNELLENFARDLADRHIRFLMIAVNGHLDRFPAIARVVRQLDRSHLLEYIEVKNWFSGGTEYGSPEGHSWGVKANEIVGRNLARVVRGELGLTGK